MKSRTEWIIAGDKNTKFYHLTTLNRRATNKILSLLKTDDTWTFNPSEIHSLISSNFQELFSSSHDCSFHDSFGFSEAEATDHNHLATFSIVPSPQ